MLFSQRKRLKGATKAFQIDDIDADLRNSLWNALDICCFRSVWFKDANYNSMRSASLRWLFREYWHSLFKAPIDTIPDRFSDALASIRKLFFSCAWNEVYDLVEFTAANCPNELRQDLVLFCNSVLERENSAYRFVGGIISQVTSADEVKAIDEALESTVPLSGVHAQLENALRLMSDRKNPDYRNSIKDSISAVEGLCQILTRDKKATLGQALTVLEKKGHLHGALKAGFSALYGYTNDAEGIRHAMMDEPTLTRANATFMLVTCSAFVNFLTAKAGELGIELRKN